MRDRLQATYNMDHDTDTIRDVPECPLIGIQEIHDTSFATNITAMGLGGGDEWPETFIDFNTLRDIDFLTSDADTPPVFGAHWDYMNKGWMGNRNHPNYTAWLAGVNRMHDHILLYSTQGLVSTGFSYETMGNCIRSAVNDLLPVYCGIQYDNAPPVAATTPGTVGAFIRPQILDAGSFQADMAERRRWRRLGFLKLSIYTQLNYGDQTAREIADVYTAGLRGKSFTAQGGKVTFRSPDVTVHGIDQGNWRIDLDIPFWSDEIDLVGA